MCQRDCCPLKRIEENTMWKTKAQQTVTIILFHIYNFCLWISFTANVLTANKSKWCAEFTIQCIHAAAAQHFHYYYYTTHTPYTRLNSWVKSSSSDFLRGSNLITSHFSLFALLLSNIGETPRNLSSDAIAANRQQSTNQKEKQKQNVCDRENVSQKAEEEENEDIFSFLAFFFFSIFFFVLFFSLFGVCVTPYKNDKWYETIIMPNHWRFFFFDEFKIVIIIIGLIFCLFAVYFNHGAHYLGIGKFWLLHTPAT